MADTTPPRRNPAPDQLKAFLLALVIFGHTFVQPESGDLGKWAIYGFHMPMFLFLSGYMIRLDRFRARSWGSLLAHYWRRMLAAWLLVSLAYLAVFDRQSYVTTPHLLGTLLLTPVWHLWYIPALLLALCATRALAGATLGRWTLALVAVGGMVAFETPLSAHVLPLAVHEHLDHRYLGYFGWFLLGVAVRAGWLRVPALGCRITAVVLGAAGWLVGYFGHPWLAATGFAVLNLGATLSVPELLRRLSTPLPVLGPSLGRIGEYSLWVYLLHPFITNVARVPATDPMVWQRLGGLALTAAILAVSAGVTWTVKRAAQARVSTPVEIVS